MEDRYCERCYSTGELDCYCGGDLCICDRYGTYPCPDCTPENGFICDEIEVETPELKTAQGEPK